ncbi:MAG TPA: FAD-dependent oxidoreductase [Candidatus Limnocylindrales bacterium]|nr:FAD-dependent oxidoreductase [Candidatus Limnocylindrales bacterium]
MTTAPDLVVVGAGVLGTWTALRASERGRSTVLLDAFGPGDIRATSGDESRIIRSSHGADDLLPRWSRESRRAWIALGEESGSPIFEPCGVAWFARRANGFEAESEATLRALAIPTTRLTPAEAADRWPIRADDLAFVLHEPEAGALRARDGVRVAAEAFRRRGGDIRLARVRPGRVRSRRLLEVVADDGRRIPADAFVFAAGPWLATLFPAIVGPMLSVTRQDVVYIGPPAADPRWTSAEHPAWIDFDGSFYGIPSIGGRGFKIAPDFYGPPVDPDAVDRVVEPDSIATVRAYLARRFPDLAAEPVVETRVCQYETTLDTHWLIDRHPEWENAWLVGGGSGHAFKHGPRIGSYVIDRLDGAADAAVDDRFSLARPRSLPPGDPRGAPPARPLPARPATTR